VIQEFFFDGVLAGPGDSTQPAGDGGPGPLQVSGEGLDVGAADGEQGLLEPLWDQFAALLPDRSRT
jgi:hypothetical protein